MRIPILLAAAAVCAGAALATAIHPGGRALAQTGTSNDLRLQVARAHTAMVRRFAFSRDGRLLSTTDHVGITKIWDFEAGTVLKELSRDADGIELRLLPNGKMLAEMYLDDYQLSIAAITTLTGETVDHLASVDGGAPQNAFSSDGRTVATLTKAGELSVHDLETGEQIARHAGRYDTFRGMQTIPSPSHEMVLDIEVGDSGAALHVAGLTVSATAWSARLPGLEAVASGVEAGFSPSGKFVHATSKLDEGTRLDVWDAQTGTPILSRSYPFPRGERPHSLSEAPSAVVWSPSEERIAYNLVARSYVQSEIIDLAKDKTIAQIDTRLIDANFDRTVEKRGSFRPFVTTFLRNEDLVVTTGELLVWDLARGVPVRQLHEVGLEFGGESGLAETSSFLPREIDDLLVMHASGQIFRYKAPELEFAGALSQDTLPVYHGRWTPDGSHILHYAAKSDELYGISQDYLHALDADYGHLDSGRSLGDVREAVTRSQEESTVHAVAPDLSYAIVSKDDGGAASIFRRQPDGSFLDSGAPLTFPSAYIGNVPIDWIYPDKFRISPSGDRILSRPVRHKLGVFDAASGGALSTINIAPEKEEKALFRAMAFSGNEQRAYLSYKRYEPPQTSSDADGFMTAWPVSDGARAEEFQLKGTDYRVEGECDISTLSAISNDGSFALGLLSGSRAPCLARLPGGELAVEMEAAGLRRYGRGSEPPGIFPDARGDFTRDGRLVAAVHGSAATVWNTVDGSVQATLRGHLGDISSIHFSPDGSKLVTSSLDGTLRVWSQDGAELVRFYVFADGEWIAITPDGFFNSSELGAERLNVVQGGTLLPMDNFFDALFRPDLVHAALAGDPDGKLRAAADALNLGMIWRSGLPPVVDITVEGGIETDAETATVVIALTPQNGGIGQLELKVNGATQTIESPHAGASETAALRQIVHLTPGHNQINVIAYNRANLIASRPAEASVISMAELDHKPRLHILSIGVDRYEDERLNLTYAVSDATAVANAMTRVAEESSLFSEVITLTLENEDVVAANLEAAFDRVAASASPEDIFILFLAGHGKTVDGRYNFLTHDFAYSGPESFVTEGIGQDTWQDWLARIPAQRSLLLYDTCESGSLARDRDNSAIELDAAVTRLARATGRTVMTAATDSEPALEGYGGHGVFTYAVLEGLGLGDRDKDGQIEVGELAIYVGEVLPTISYDAFGHRQIPKSMVRGAGFSLGQPQILLTGE